MSFLDDIARAPTKPQLETIEEARKVTGDPSLSLDEYTLARMVYSEHASGSPVELCCLADAAANKAAAEGRSIHLYATGGAGFGAQGGARQVSTARAPTPRHIKAALAVLRNRWWFLPPPARGIAKGARRFFDPRAQLKLSQDQGTGKFAPPLVVLRRWTYDLAWVNRAELELGTRRGSNQEEWVGPIPGVDPYELMLMRPKTALQDSLYAEAVKVIESRGAYKGRMPTVGELGAVALVVLGLGLAAAAAGGVA